MVKIFITNGCLGCRKSIKFFQDNSVDFVKKDFSKTYIYYLTQLCNSLLTKKKYTRKGGQVEITLTHFFFFFLNLIRTSHKNSRYPYDKTLLKM